MDTDDIETEPSITITTKTFSGYIKYFVLFIIYLFINTTIFNDNVLTKFSDTMIGSSITTKGTIIGGASCILIYMGFNYLYDNDYL